MEQPSQSRPDLGFCQGRAPYQGNFSVASASVRGFVELPPVARLHTFAAAVSNLVSDAAASSVVSALAAAGVPSILLRGPAVARWLYEEESGRPYADVDLLVPAERFPQARPVLRAAGFTESQLERRFARDRPAHAETWARQADGASVDLHRTAIGIGASPALVWETIISGAEAMTLGGTQVDVPGVGARALFVALHAAQHGAGWGHPLEDLSRALERVPPETWTQAASLAERLEATPAFAAGLRLLPAGESLAITLGLPSGQLPDRTLGGSESFHLAQGIAWLRETPGLSRKTVFFARKLAPPPATMRLRSPLARRGRLGLGAAYLWRVARLSWRGSRIMPSWIRSRRAGRDELPAGVEAHDRDELP